MNIYSSEKVLPYVYQCVHKTTGKIYIGSRTNKKQKLPSHLDFPKYRTSSKYVKPIFDEFNWFIVAEFFDPKDAYNFEQELINEQWQVSKEMSLNRRCDHGKKSFNFRCNHNSESKRKIGDFFRDKPKTESHKEKLRKPHSEEHNRKIGDSLRGLLRSEEHCKNLSKSLKGVSLTEEHCKNMSIARQKNIERYNFIQNDITLKNLTIRELCFLYDFTYNTARTNFYKGSYKNIMLQFE